MSNSFINKTNTKREDQRFFLNSKEVYGVQSLEVSYQQNAIPLRHIGMGTPIMVPNGPQKGSFKVDTLVIDSDYFLQLTGATGFNGYVLRSRTDQSSNFSFESGYLTSYNSRCSIGEIPQISVDVVAYGNVGKLNSTDSPVISGQLASINTGIETFTPSIAGPGSITLNLDDFSTNRVLAYDLTYDVERNPIYALGSRVPNRVETNFPISVTLSFQFAVNNYIAQKIHNFPNSPKVNNINLSLKAFDTNSGIIDYNLNNMTLIQEQQSAGVQGQTIVSALYRGYIGRSTAEIPSGVTNVLWQGSLFAFVGM